MSDLINAKLAAIAAGVKEWSARNFPNNQPHHPLLGMVEEWSEYVSARRGFYNAVRDDDRKKHSDDMRDAVGDILIYAADYSWRNGLVFMFDYSASDHVQPLHETLGKLSHYHLKLEQGIRYPAPEAKVQKQAKLNAVISGVAFLCAGSIDPWQQLEVTWNKVKERNWARNPMRAATGTAK